VRASGHRTAGRIWVLSFAHGIVRTLRGEHAWRLASPPSGATDPTPPRGAAFVTTLTPASARCGGTNAVRLDGATAREHFGAAVALNTTATRLLPGVRLAEVLHDVLGRGIHGWFRRAKSKTDLVERRR
jgi:hypothetical protein